MTLLPCFHTRSVKGGRPRSGRISGIRPKGCLLALLLLGNWAGTAVALPLSYTGTFAADDEIKLIPFSAPFAATVTLTSFSFGGGFNGANTNIASGGFAPVVSLFQSTGTRDLLGTARAGDGSCAGTADSATGYCWDVQLTAQLAAGDYVAVVTQDDNLPSGSSLDDGFSQSGAYFTGLNFLGSQDSFVLADGTSRDGHWALDIDIQATAVPTPGSLSLIALGLVLSPRIRKAA